MQVLYFSNEYPHDDTQTLLRNLLNHSKSNLYPLLAQFFTEATRAIREEINKLPKSLQQLLPAFTSVLELVDDKNRWEGPICGSIDGALLVIVQLAIYIGYVFVARNSVISLHTTNASQGTQRNIQTTSSVFLILALPAWAWGWYLQLP
jgi:hypothetical protein